VGALSAPTRRALRREPPPPPPSLGLLPFAGIVLLALVVRLLVLTELNGSPWIDVPVGDAKSYDTWARSIAAGDWLGREVFYQAPLYPYFLGTVYALFGTKLALVRALQVALGSLAAGLIGVAATRLTTRTAGIVAGGLAALYAPAVMYDLTLEKSSLGWFLTALLFYLGVARPDPPPVRWALAAGAALGALALVRENALLLILALIASYGAARMVPLGLGLLLVLGPVAWRNHEVGGVFLPTASNAGVNFYIGNGAEADGLYRPLVAGRGHPDYEAADATRIAQELAGRELTASEVSGVWFQRALQEVKDEPLHWGELVARKTKLVFDRHEIMDAVALEVFTDESRVLGVLAPVLGFGVLFPLFLGGLLVASGGHRLLRFPLDALMALTVSIVLFFVAARFRLTLVPFLLPFAALALVRGWRSRERWIGLAGIVAAAALSWWPYALPGDARATSYANLANEYLRLEQPAEAERWARQACARDPSSAEASFTLGMALRHQEKDGEAFPVLERARELEPAYEADVLAEQGAIRARAGDRVAAAALLERALELEPEHEAALRYRRTLQGETEESQRSE